MWEPSAISINKILSPTKSNFDELKHKENKLGWKVFLSQSLLCWYECLHGRELNTGSDYSHCPHFPIM